MLGATAALTTAVGNSRGRVVAAVSGAVTAMVPKSALTELAASPGVQSVARPVRAYPDATSQGIAASDADTWQSDGLAGQGVAIGIVDAGFAGLTTEAGAGRLPTGQRIAGNHCANANATPHGTAVAEIVHQMAPAAALVLYCVDDNIGFKAAEAQVQAAGIKIVNSSLGFPGDSRGDGTGDANSTAMTVKTARNAGILWIQSAGNNAADHWGGTFNDANHDGLADLNPGVDQATADPQADYVAVASGGSAAFVLQWDDWPATPVADTVSFSYQQYNPSTGKRIGTPQTMTAQPGFEPWLGFNVTNSSAGDAHYAVWVGLLANTAHRRYDLSYWGEVYTSRYASLDPDAAAAQSITEPASSPFAVAAGAAYWQDRTLEAFSSQGPTIDGRVKPDITGFDGVSSTIYGSPDGGYGFFGTSAAAPHVAGAAALVKAGHMTWTADQLQDYLEDQAGNDPPTSNQMGAGILHLPTPAVDTLAASKYVPLTQPVRILDTRIGPGPRGQLSAAHTITIPIPASVPISATAVVVNLTGLGSGGTTYLSVFSSEYSSTSNLNLSSTDKTAAVAVEVAIGRTGTSRYIKLRNAAAATHAIIDLLGYFDPAAGAAGYRYGALNPTRILDTRSTIGGHRGTVPFGGELRIRGAGLHGVPADAKAVVVTVTGLGVSSGGGYISMYPNSFNGVSTVNVGQYARANLAVVKLGSNGLFGLRNMAPAGHVVIDLLGWFGPSGTASFVPFVSPIRKSDTLSGLGGRTGSLGSGTIVNYPGASSVGVPAGARALWTGVIVLPTATGYLRLYPQGAAAATSNLSFTRNRTVPNAAVITQSGGGNYSIYNPSGTTRVIVDLFGYFS